MEAGKKALFAVTAILLGLLLAGAAKAQVKIGFVDMQQVVAKSKPGQAALARLKAEASKKQEEVKAREQEIAKAEEELQKQHAVLSDAARREKEDAIQRRKRDLRRIAEDYSRDLAARENELLLDLQRDILAAVRDYGKEKGYTLIIERNQGGVMYSADALDLTQDIIERMDKSREGSPPSPPSRDPKK